jgi:urease accessory protein
MSTLIKSVLAAVAGAAFSASALAHTGTDTHVHSAFIGGLLHPFTGVDHLCAMLGVGMWSAVVARRGTRDMLWGPLAFATLMLVGAVLGQQGVQVPAVEPMIAASLVACGLLLASSLRLTVLRTATLVGGFALFHGLAHGYELADHANAWQVLSGILTGTVLLHGVGLALGWTLRGSRAWMARLSGAGIAVLGSCLLLQLA